MLRTVIVVVVFRRASGRGIYASDHVHAADYRDIDSQAVSAAGAANPVIVLRIALMLYAHRLPPLQTLSNGAFYLQRAVTTLATINRPRVRSLAIKGTN